MATKVKLRKKPIKGNRQSLYLDFYPAIVNTKGQLTRREFLGYYLIDNPKTPLDKQHNKETLQIAEQIRQIKENQINKPEIYSGEELEKLKQKEKADKNFFDYFMGLVNQRQNSNHDNWVSASLYFEKFAGSKIRFSDLTEKFCNEFKEYLLSTNSFKSDKSPLAQNSAVSYFNKFKAVLKQAYKDGFLQFDLNSKIKPIKQAETQRNYLTIDELNKLVATECNNPLMKKAALFSALTGLRFSDIQKLKWSELQYSPEHGHSIHFTQQKTKGVEVLPISGQAFDLLGEPGIGERVFEGLEYSAYENKHLYRWIAAAGIKKDITFHCFRHTYATLQLSMGTDIYTVSKLLGHRELKTTQIYAKVVDQMKRDAADKIKLSFE